MTSPGPPGARGPPGRCDPSDCLVPSLWTQQVSRTPSWPQNWPHLLTFLKHLDAVGIFLVAMDFFLFCYFLFFIPCCDVTHSLSTLIMSFKTVKWLLFCLFSPVQSQDLNYLLASLMDMTFLFLVLIQIRRCANRSYIFCFSLSLCEKQ